MSDESFEVQLISAILEEKEIREVIRHKVTPDFFYDAYSREIFNYLQQEYVQHGAVPSLMIVQDAYPDFEPVMVEDPISVLCAQVRGRKLHNDMGEAIEEITRLTRGDPEEGLRLLKQKAATMSAVHTMSEDMDVTKTKQAVLQEYNMIKSQEGLLGIPYPWERLNEATLGMQNGQFIVLFGRPKMMKTFLGLYACQYAHAFNPSITPLVMTKEMTAEEMRRRLVALRCGLDYEKYRNGELSLEDEVRFENDLDKFEQTQPLIVTECTSVGMEAVTEFRAKIEEYGAGLAFFDGVYMLGEDWKDLTKVTRGFKDVAKSLKIPIIGTTQAKQGAEKTKGESLTEIAYADSFNQDADLIIRIMGDTQNLENHERIIKVTGQREGKGCSFLINAKPCTDFTQKSLIEDDDGALSGVSDGLIHPDEEDDLLEGEIS